MIVSAHLKLNFFQIQYQFLCDIAAEGEEEEDAEEGEEEEEAPADGVSAGKLTVVRPSSTAVDKFNENSTTTEKPKQLGVCEKVFYVNSRGKKCFFTPGLAPRKRIRQRDVQPSSLTPSNEDFVGSDQEDTENQIEASKTDNPNIIRQ